MRSYNRVIVAGNLGKDAELRTAASGRQVCRFSVATSKKVKETEKTTWFNVVILNENLAKIAAGLKKGEKVLIEGSLEVEQNEQGKTFVSVIVSPFDGTLVFLGGGNGGGQRSAPAPEPGSYDDEPPFDPPY